MAWILGFLPRRVKAKAGKASWIHGTLASCKALHLHVSLSEPSDRLWQVTWDKVPPQKLCSAVDSLASPDCAEISGNLEHENHWPERPLSLVGP